MDARLTNQSESMATAAGRRGWPAEGFTEAYAAIIVAIVGVVTCSIAPSPWVLALITVPVAFAFSYWIVSRRNRRHRHLIENQRDVELEIRSWQDRWQTLQREAHQTTTALSRMRDGVILLNHDSEILLINPAAKYLLNLPDDQYFYERPFNEIVRIPDLTQAVAASGKGEGPQKALVEISAGDTIRPVKARVDRFPAAGHDNLLMTLRDETEAHRLEEMRREFVANISHELKTPLAAIKGYAETVELAIKDDPEAASYFIAQIQSQCQRLERLIADMMQLARAQSGRGKMRITTVSLPRVIAESIKSYAPVAEAKQIELIVDSPNLEIQAEHEATLTIANNLIGNAIHYTPEGGRVTVACRDGESHATLVVEDTGVGIPEAEHKRIFERFYRVEKSRSSSDGGTGIGLSVVKNLAVAMGGGVRVNSKPGEGATFEVRFPRNQPAGDAGSTTTFRPQTPPPSRVDSAKVEESGASPDL